MIYWLNILSLINGISFGTLGSIATALALIPKFRHKAVKSIAAALELGREQ